MPFKFNSLLSRLLGFFRFLDPHGAVVEFFGGQLSQGLLQGRFGLGDDAVVLKEGSGTDGGKNQVGVLDVVKKGNIHIHEKAVRCLNMRRPVFPRRRLRRFRENWSTPAPGCPWGAGTSAAARRAEQTSGPPDRSFFERRGLCRLWPP